MTGDTNMKKENTINQEQEEMVFAEPPAQVIFNEKKEPDDIVEDDAEEIDEEDYEIEDDGDEEDDTPKNKFESCCVCHRTEEQGAKLIHMPTGLSICSDCMQKSFDSFNSGFGGGNGIQFLDLSNMDFNNLKDMNLGDLLSGTMSNQKPKTKKAKKIQKKTERWQAIAEAAAKQCDRGMIPVVHTPVTMEQAFDMASSLEYNMIPYELQDGIQVSRQIVEEACSKESVGIFIGPEGGLEKEEVEKAMEIGAKPITLGKRILRTETAGMALLSIMMFQLQK